MFEQGTPHVERLGNGVVHAARDAFDKGAPHVQRLGSDVAHMATDALEKSAPQVQQFSATVEKAARNLLGKFSAVEEPKDLLSARAIKTNQIMDSPKARL